jgi:hypothetical protein
MAGPVACKTDRDGLPVSMRAGLAAPSQWLLRRWLGLGVGPQMRLRSRFLRWFSVFIDIGDNFPVKVGFKVRVVNF